MGHAHYVRQLDNLRDDLLRLGSMVEHALINAVRSLENWDTIAAAQVIQDDALINQTRWEVEEQVIKLMAAQLANERDPRLLAAAFAIAGELERIGDYACSIARRVESITRQPALVLPPPGLGEMTRLAKKMLNTSLEVFLRQDVAMAYSLRGDEDRMDELEEQLQAELMDHARAEPERIEAALGMLDVVHALERVADRATNIGSRVIYLTVSINKELNPENMRP